MTDDLDRHQTEVEATRKAISQWSGKTVKKATESINENSMSFFGFNPTSNKEIKTSKKEFADWKRAYQSLKENMGFSYSEEYTPISDDGDKRTVPVTKSSLGDDKSPSPTSPVRVTPDFSDGPKLRELDELKKKMESLQRLIHELEVNHQTNDKTTKGKIEKLKKELKSTTDSVEGEKSDLAPTPNQDGLGNVVEM